MNTYKILIACAKADKEAKRELSNALDIVSAEVVDKLNLSITSISESIKDTMWVGFDFLVEECDIFIPVLTNETVRENSDMGSLALELTTKAFLDAKHILALAVAEPGESFMPNLSSSAVFSDTESLVNRVRELVWERIGGLCAHADENAHKIISHSRFNDGERGTLDALCLLSPRYLIDEAELSDKARAGVKSLEKKGFIYRNENNGYIAVPEAISNAYYEAEHSPEGYDECLKMLDRWNDDSASKNEGHEKLYKHLSFFIEKRAHGVDEKCLCELEARCERALASWVEGEAFSNSLNKMINIVQYNLALKDRLRYYLAKLERTKESADKGALASTYLSISEAYEALGDTRSAGEYREKARRTEE